MQHGDGGAQVTEVLAEHDRRRRRRDRRDAQLRAVGDDRTCRARRAGARTAQEPTPSGARVHVGLDRAPSPETATRSAPSLAAAAVASSPVETGRALARSGRPRSARQARARRRARRAAAKQSRSSPVAGERRVEPLGARDRTREAENGGERGPQVVAGEADEPGEVVSSVTSPLVRLSIDGAHATVLAPRPPVLGARGPDRSLPRRRPRREQGDPPAPRPPREARLRRDLLLGRSRSRPARRAHVALPGAVRAGHRRARDRRGAARRGAGRAHRPRGRRPPARAARRGRGDGPLPDPARDAGDADADAGDGLADRDRRRLRAPATAASSASRRPGSTPARARRASSAAGRPSGCSRPASARATSTGSSSSSRSRPTTSVAAARSTSAPTSRSTPRTWSRSSSAR